MFSCRQYIGLHHPKKFFKNPELMCYKVDDVNILDRTKNSTFRYFFIKNNYLSKSAYLCSSDHTLNGVSWIHVGEQCAGAGGFGINGFSRRGQSSSI